MFVCESVLCISLLLLCEMSCDSLCFLPLVTTSFNVLSTICFCFALYLCMCVRVFCLVYYAT